MTGCLVAAVTMAVSIFVLITMILIQPFLGILVVLALAGVLLPGPRKPTPKADAAGDRERV